MGTTIPAEAAAVDVAEVEAGDEETIVNVAKIFSNLATKRKLYIAKSVRDTMVLGKTSNVPTHSN